eukprot:m51a1_g12522 hypothetical protein (85) ;mRNA; f:5988-8196
MAAAVENGASEAPEAPEQEEYQEEQQDDQDDINWNDMTTLASMGPADYREATTWKAHREYEDAVVQASIDLTKNRVVLTMEKAV